MSCSSNSLYGLLLCKPAESKSYICGPISFIFLDCSKRTNLGRYGGLTVCEEWARALCLRTAICGIKCVVHWRGLPTVWIILRSKYTLRGLPEVYCGRFQGLLKRNSFWDTRCQGLLQRAGQICMSILCFDIGSGMDSAVLTLAEFHLATKF